MVVAFIVGVVLGCTGLAIAGTPYWSKSSQFVYSCQGATNEVICTSQSYSPRYKILISKRLVGMYFGNDTPVFTCRVSVRPAACSDLR
jgi:hypothetical protein